MTAHDVKLIVGAIGFTAEVDPDLAHKTEDELYRDVLAAIAGGAPNAAELATEALKSRMFKFPRYCS